MRRPRTAPGSSLPRPDDHAHRAVHQLRRRRPARRVRPDSTRMTPVSLETRSLLELDATSSSSSRPRTASSTPSTASPTTSTPARRSASSASPARARASRRWRSWGCCRQTAGSGFRAIRRPGSAGDCEPASCADARQRHRDDLPGPDDLAQPGLPSATRSTRRSGAPERAGKAGARTRRSSCSTSSASPTRSAAASTRTSSRAGCASGR